MMLHVVIVPGQLDKQSVSAHGEAVGRCVEGGGAVAGEPFEPLLVLGQHLLEGLQVVYQVAPGQGLGYLLAPEETLETFEFFFYRLFEMLLRMTELKSLWRNRLLGSSGIFPQEWMFCWLLLVEGGFLLARSRQNSICEQSTGSDPIILLRWFHSRMTSSFWDKCGATVRSKNVRKASTSFRSPIIIFDYYTSHQSFPCPTSTLWQYPCGFGLAFNSGWHNFKFLQYRNMLKQELSQTSLRERGKEEMGEDTTSEEANIIKLTRSIVRDMTEEQKLAKAKAHVLDALHFREPRPQSQSLTTPSIFRVVYAISVSSPWHWLLFVLSYTFMYLVILDNNRYALKISLEACILFIFWADTIMLKYINTFDRLDQPKGIIWVDYRTVLLLLMSADLFIFAAHPGIDSRPILPFRVLRFFLPIVFDHQLRKVFISLASSYTDILVYVIFFTIVVCGFALIGNRALTVDPNFVDPNYPKHIDPYASDYLSLDKMIFITYIVATYDSYPDNEWIAIQNFQPNIIFFIVFIFMNMFLFSSIPGSLIYNKFRATYGKLILFDELKQQKSLIIAFVTLAGSDRDLTFNAFINFLNYLYRYKIRYVEFITDICMKTDQNNDRSVQVSEFMKLGKIIIQNSAMIPPSFDDIQLWIDFRNYMKNTLHVKAIVQHWIFELVASIVILATFINAIFLVYNVFAVSRTIDDVLVWVFVLELAFRIVAIGPENFFADRWNNLDSMLVVLGVTFFFIQGDINISSLARMGRIFRIASLARIISHSNFINNFRVPFFEKLKVLFQIILEIIPIILKFMPLFMFSFYVFGVVGMELFHNSYQTTGSPSYNNYQQFSSFRTFIQSQYVMVQILTEAGWSLIAFDHCWRNPQYYGYIMLYFCLMHIIITYVIATLVKGIFWEVYFTVDQIFYDREVQTQEEREKEQAYEERAEEIREINEQIVEKEYITPDTILKRELYENNLDERIFTRIRKDRERQLQIREKQFKSNLVVERKNHLGELMSSFNIPAEDVGVSEDRRRYLSYIKEESDVQEPGNKREKIDLFQIEEFSQEDFQSQIEELFHQVLLEPKVKYSHVVGNSKIFNQFLNTKFVKPQSLIRDELFDIEANPLYNSQSMNLHILQMNQLLNIQISKREHKAAIIQSLYQSDIIGEETVDKLIKRKLYDKVFKIDTNGTLRKLFLSQTSEELIKKFQVQHFSHLYGKSFKEINRITLEPLLKVEATLTYTLRNILRYPQIQNLQFFQMLTHIEDQYSNQVMKKGSLFKFLYKLDGDNTWFSVQFKRQWDLKVHFVKTGVWCYGRDMEDHQVYYARDVFNWQGKENEPEGEKAVRHKFMKRFYQSFQGLAFSLLNQKPFFSSNPRKYVYDLFIQTFDAEKLRRFVEREHEISKVMIVILSKEERRSELGTPQLPYELTDLKIQEQKENELSLSFEDSSNDPYEKLKNVTARDHQKIVESEGLPFSYITNLMKQLSDTYQSYGQNFTYQIQRVFNDQFKIVAQKHEENKIEVESQGGLGKKRNHMAKSAVSPSIKIIEPE